MISNLMYVWSVVMFFVGYFISQGQSFLNHKLIYHSHSTDVCNNAHLCQAASPIHMCKEYVQSFT